MTPPFKLNIRTRFSFYLTHEWGEPITPRLVFSKKGPVILEPWDKEYDPENLIDISNIEEKVLPSGADFSRIWCDKGCWKPVRV